MYNEKIKNHSSNPFNKKVLEDFTFHHKDNLTMCWDELEVYVLLENDIIENFSFEWDTSMLSTAWASILWEYVINKNIEEVLKLKYSDLEKLFEYEIPWRRKSASVLWLLNLINWIYKYKNINKSIDFDYLIDV